MEHSKFILTFFLLTFLATFCQTVARCGSELQQRILSQIFLNYNKDVQPPPGDSPLHVTCNANILNIVSVDEKNHLWEVNLFFRESWNDPRLQYTNLLQSCPKFQYISLITPESVAKLWKPNLFFTTEIKGEVHNIIQPNVLIRISPNGDVLYSVHVEVTLHCTGIGSKPGEFMCPMALYPYGPTTDEMLLSWEAQNPIQINRTEVILDDHVLGDIDTFVTTIGARTGLFSQVQANFHFLRKACLN